MKIMIFFLMLNVPMLYGMETAKKAKIDIAQKVKEPHKSRELAGDPDIGIWKLLGHEGVPSLKFITALKFIFSPEQLMTSNIPLELKEYVLNVLSNKVFDTLNGKELNGTDVPLLLLVTRADPDTQKSLIEMAKSSGNIIALTLLEKGPESAFLTLLKQERLLKNERKLAKQLILYSNPELLNVRDKDGRTPLYSVVLGRGDKKIAKWLINAGVDLNMPDNKGWTPLMSSTNLGLVAPINNDIARMLIAAGADLTVKDLKNKDVFDIARETNNREILQLLESQ